MEKLKLGKVEKHSFGYALVSAYVRPVFVHLFYKKAVFKGVENIPKDKPVMIAPNHQNAVMDALAVVFSQRFQVVFLARSDVFSNPTIAKILFFLKILPVYRIQDGKEKLALNELIFEKAVNVLENNRRVAIFPEAKHIDKRHLRILKKGVQRVAFAAEEKHDFNLGIEIVPTGIYYSNYWNFRSVLQVNYGKPIRVADFKEQYEQNPQKAMIALRNEMSDRIKEQMIDIHDLKNYESYEILREICDVPLMKQKGLKVFSQDEKFKADKEIIKKTEAIAENKPERFEEIKNRTEQYSEFLKKHHLKDYVLEKSSKSGNIFLRILLLILGLPVFVYGAVNNAIGYLLPRLITSKLKDRQFESSVNFGTGILLFPIIYLLQTLTFGFISGEWLWALAYLLSLPVTGLFAFGYHRFWVKFKSAFYYKQNAAKEEFKKAELLREEIIDLVLAGND